MSLHDCKEEKANGERRSEDEEQVRVHLRVPQLHPANLLLQVPRRKEIKADVNVEELVSGKNGRDKKRQCEYCVSEQAANKRSTAVSLTRVLACHGEVIRELSALSQP